MNTPAVARPQEPRVEPLPEGAVNLADFEAPARARLDAQARAYLNGSAADEITLRANRSAWEGHPSASLLRDEPEIAMALSGCRTLVDAGPQLIWPASSVRTPAKA